MGFVDRAKLLLRALINRLLLLLAGCAALIVAIDINLDAGSQIVAGLFQPDSPSAILISVARLALPAAGLWLVYKGLR